MSLTDMLAQLDDLTDEERLTLSDAARAGVDEKTAARTVDTPGVQRPSISKEDFLREWRKLGPMDDETYAAYKKGIALSSQIDEDVWQ